MPVKSLHALLASIVIFCTHYYNLQSTNYVSIKRGKTLNKNKKGKKYAITIDADSWVHSQKQKQNHNHKNMQWSGSATATFHSRQTRNRKKPSLELLSSRTQTSPLRYRGGTLHHRTRTSQKKHTLRHRTRSDEDLRKKLKRKQNK